MVASDGPRLMRRTRSSVPRPRTATARRAWAAAAGLALLVACSGGSDDSDDPMAIPRAQPLPSPTTSSPAAPAPAAGDEQRAIWVAAEGGRVLQEVDLRAASVRRTVPVPGAPHNIVVGPGGIVAASLPATGQLVLIEPGGPPVTVDLGGSPHDVKVAGDAFVVANESAARLDLVDRGGRMVGAVELPANPHDIAPSPDGRTLWTSLDGRSEVAVVDVRARAVRDLVPTGGSPHDLLVGPNDDVWVSDWGGGLMVLTASGGVVKVPLGDEPQHLAASPDGKELWVTDNGARQLFVLDAPSRSVVASVPLSGAPHHVVVDRGRVAVADNSGSQVVVVDRSGRQVVGAFAVGSGPHGIAIAPP